MPDEGFKEIGSSGLRIIGGNVKEEFLKQLNWDKAVNIYQEMSTNDPVIGGILFATEMLLRNVSWTVLPASMDPVDEEVADFVDSARNDMSHTWTDFISEVLSMLTYGWAGHEIVYKLRQGPTQNDPMKRSKYDDGRIGWRKLALRGQDTLDRWEFDDNGEIEGFIQRDPNSAQTVFIPKGKLLIFRTTSKKNNPEGRSILRNAYRPWFFKKRIEEIEGIGIERDLAGLPVAMVPPEILSTTASAEQQQLLNEIKKIVTNIRRDEQEGVIFPSAYDDKGNLMFELKLLSTGGARQFDTNEIVNRYDKRIAMSVLADFIMLGQDKVGSFALSSDKTKLFSTALGAWLKSIADTFNRVAIPRLLKVNNIPLEHSPQVEPGDIEKEDVEKWANAVNKLVLSGVLVSDENLDAKARDLLDVAPAETTEM